MTLPFAASMWYGMAAMIVVAVLAGAALMFLILVVFSRIEIRPRR